MKAKRQRTAIIFLIPAVVLLLCFMIYPLGKTIFYSFTAWYNFSTEQTFIGLDNYKELIADPVIRVALRNTVILMAGVLIFQIGFALILAIMVDGIRHCFKFFRTIYFFPIVISATAIGLMFTLIYKYEYGLLNYFVVLFGGEKQVWINEKSSIYLALIPVVWQYVGFYFVILITGLNNISGELYEAAAIDGATGFQKVRYVSIPLLHNVMCTCVVLGVTGALKVFDLPWTMFPKGIPLGETWLTGTYMYYQTFNTKNVDYSSAIAVLIVVLGIVTAKVINTIFKEKDY